MRSRTQSSAMRRMTCARSLATFCCRSSFTPAWRRKRALFDFGGVVEAITAKLVRRHPHVFGDAKAFSPDDVKVLWGRIKADEKQAKRTLEAKDGRPAEATSGALEDPAGVAGAFSRHEAARPEKSVSTGTMFVLSWTRSGRRSSKSRPKIADGSAQALSGEVGDLLFAAVNLARHLKVDPEAALRGANAKFERRFAHIENRLAEAGRTPDSASLDDMERLWDEAKARERQPQN